MEVIADGLQIALLGETRKETLHTAVELVFTIKLERTRERGQGLKQQSGGD